MDSGNRFFFPIPESFYLMLIWLKPPSIHDLTNLLLLRIDGCTLQVFVMYHATREVENVAGVLDRGFNISQSKGRNLLLGDGLYVSRDIFKTQEYGEVSLASPHSFHCIGLKYTQVCFKLLVYPGKAVRVTEMADPLRTTWQVFLILYQNFVI